MLRTRVATAFLLLIFFLAALFLFPHALWVALVLAVAAAAAWEWGVLSRWPWRLRTSYALATPLAVLTLLWFATHGALTMIYAVACVFWIVLAPAWLAAKWRVHHPLAAALTGWIVLVPTSLALAQLREAGPGLVLWLMSIVWVADTAAYFAGRRFGKHKLAPQVSPGKTWEGFAGALVCVTLYALAATAGGVHQSIMGIAAPKLAVSAALAFLLVHWVITGYSVVGDLFESWMKRVAGLKDSGGLLPGHGGVLDRIDSLTSTLPLFALFWALNA
ncbi:MAG TPA: phosphatidate cytidylyltransferase [Burkholderiales bacterium]|nr:phosphatidate cytidylyltransferase [Burkholderiales bacterium]